MAAIVVYEHWRPDTNQPFYVGSGSRQRAGAVNGARRSARYRTVLAELTAFGLKPEVRIISEHEDQFSGCAAEAERVRFWRDQGIELVNQHNRGVRILTREGRFRMRFSTGRPLLLGDRPLTKKEKQKRWYDKHRRKNSPSKSPQRPT